MQCPNAYYAADVAKFLATNSSEILGIMTTNSLFAVDPATRDAWMIHIEVLKNTLKNLNGTVFLEFKVPRIGSRIDAVLISGPVVLVIEFKVGATEFTRSALNQVWDYALDLKNFHKASHLAPVVPILVATQAECSDTSLHTPTADGVLRPARCNQAGLEEIIRVALGRKLADREVDAQAWGLAPYEPTPTIIQAARALYSQHSVEAIARNDAGARNLSTTCLRIESLIDTARRDQRKVVVFLTGVPGAGKTLVGLNIATKRSQPTEPTHAVYLSGNGPLVEVLREALTLDEIDRTSSRRKGRKGEVKEKVKAFIQNVHHFRDAALSEAGPPADHVVIFDEAQRAWTREKTADFMLRKKKRSGFTQSEPEFLLAYLDRHKDWAVVICLVGGGQEINQGEAGISAWLRAITEAFLDWHVYISPNLTDSEYAAGHALELLQQRSNVFTDDSLHLSVSRRSFRAEHVSTFVKAVLDCQAEKAYESYQGFSPRYPIALTRDLDQAKQWIRSRARGTESYGILASSGALRLRPHAINVRVDVNPIHWFLSNCEDIRSSFYLEDVATEFQVQGLELDWACVAWDADLRYTASGWSHHSFVGSSWQNIRRSERQEYLRNAYRVLLTRARQGMVVFVPTGDISDPTRSPAFYDSTFVYLKRTGIPVLE